MFLATTKYPASLQFLLMTLGPMLVALAALDGARGRLVRWLTVFGRVPLFFYLLHIPLIHAVAVGIATVRSPQALTWLYGNHPMRPGEPPLGYAWSLPLLYTVTLAVVCALYWPCRWYAGVNRRHPGGVLSYL